MAMGVLLGLFAPQAPVYAQSSHLLEIEFTPTKRAQIAIWIENDDGDFLQTVRLTQAVAYRGVGNRPGAMLMNSGYRWPYGRREGILPVWGHRRSEAPGAAQFQRVIFQNRTYEGLASRTANDFSSDPYFCLSFNIASTQKEGLDAVTCASANAFNSDKGRYITQGDVDGGYHEPFPGWQSSDTRPLGLYSNYPPRRDVNRCNSGATGCNGHDTADVEDYDIHTRTVMPDIDAVTMATPPDQEFTRVQFDAPSSWEGEPLVAWLEVNTEGDYSPGYYDDQTHPTPTTPQAEWDTWAKNYGYPYRGQPSIVYKLPFQLSDTGDVTVLGAHGNGHIHGTTGAVDTNLVGIVEDPSNAPGSGVDRLHAMSDGARVRLRAISKNPCASANPPPECSMECNTDDPCPSGFLCDSNFTCAGLCEVDTAPSVVEDLSFSNHGETNSHQWGYMAFTVGDSLRDIERYDVRYSREPITDQDSFERAQPANAASMESEGLVVPTGGSPGTTTEVEFGGMLPQTTYYVAVKPVDRCNVAGPMASGKITTTEIHFTTVDPCFIATAAWGTPFAAEINALRRFRDQHLLTHGAGQWFVRQYYEYSPPVADWIRKRDGVRRVVRWALQPLVAFANWIAPEQE